MSRASRRASRRIREETDRTGALYTPDASQRLPRSFLTLERQRVLRSTYQSTLRADRLRASVSAARERLRNALKRLPVKQAIQKRSKLFDPIKSLHLHGLKNQNFCHKRQSRREVMFAIRKAGRSGSSPGRKGRYFRNYLSQYSCRG